MPPSTSLSREQAWLLAVLALIAGYVDAYTFLNYQVYGSFMSGNTTQAGLNAGEGDLAGAGYNFLPIPIFVAGVFIGTFLVYSYLANRLRLLFTLVDESQAAFDAVRDTITALKKRIEELEAAPSIPPVIYRDVWKEGTEYPKGTMCTWGGSIWHANQQTTAKPGAGADWTLAVKRGRDGKDGKDAK